MKPGFELLIFVTMILVITTVAWLDDPAPVRAQHPGRVVELKERYYYSRTCPDSHWFVERVEDIAVTVECDYVEEGQ
jgi:hypothetical protein